MSRLIKQLGYVGFEVSSLERWDRFAAEALGLRVRPGPRPDTRWLRLDERRCRVLLQQGPADDLLFIGWQVAGVAEMNAFAASLEARDIRWQAGSSEEAELRAVAGLIHFSDPDGCRHEVFHGPRLASDAFASAQVRSGFLTGDEGLGHIVIASPDRLRMLAFAKEVLGFGHSDDILMPIMPDFRFDVSFLHTNPRHHSFAISMQTPGPGPHKRVHHLMLETRSVADVGFARDRFLAQGLEIPMEIGQHTNDRMISFYGQTPSGFLIEFGCEGLKVDEANWEFVTFDHVSQWGHRPLSALSMEPPFPRVEN